MRPLIFTLFTLTLLLFKPAYAAIETYTFDKAHTQIFFSVSHLGFSNSTGKFLDFDGNFVFNREKPEDSSVNVIIKTGSIDMGDEKWDEHLKNKDFFNVEEYPDMTFKSTNIVVQNEKTAMMSGDLTMLGQTHPVTLNVTFNKADIFPMSGKYKAGFSVTGTLKRSEWGMDYGIPGIGDNVQLHIEVEGERQDADDSTLKEKE